MIGFYFLISRICGFMNQILYVGSNDSLPEPLSKSEEEFCLVMAEDGDLSCRDRLIEHNLRLVVFLAKKYENTGVDLEDLVSIGTIGLIKELATYASRCIDNEILMYLRKNKKVRAEVSIDESLAYDADGNELRLEDVLGTPQDLVTKALESKTEKNYLLHEIMKLPERDRKIMMMRYGLLGEKELTQKDVALKLGISQSYISRIEKKVIRKLKNSVKC